MEERLVFHVADELIFQDSGGISSELLILLEFVHYLLRVLINTNGTSSSEILHYYFQFVSAYVPSSISQ